jgi:hypothetical protein
MVLCHVEQRYEAQRVATGRVHLSARSKGARADEIVHVVEAIFIEAAREAGCMDVFVLRAPDGAPARGLVHQRGILKLAQ